MVEYIVLGVGRLRGKPMPKPEIHGHFGAAAGTDATGVTARIRGAGEHIPARAAVPDHEALQVDAVSLDLGRVV